VSRILGRPWQACQRATSTLSFLGRGKYNRKEIEAPGKKRARKSSGGQIHGYTVKPDVEAKLICNLPSYNHDNTASVAVYLQGEDGNKGLNSEPKFEHKETGMSARRKETAKTSPPISQ